MVDPRFKLTQFDSDVARSQAVTATVELMERANLITHHSASGPAASHVNLLSTAWSCDITPASVSDSVYQQLDTYSSESTIAHSENPMSWWAANEHRYPLIAKVARHLLSVPATALSSEVLYSDRGVEKMDKRKGLSAEQAEQVLFIMEHSF